MAEPLNTESRAALRDNQRVSVAITSPGGQRLKLLIASGSDSKIGAAAGETTGTSIGPFALRTNSLQQPAPASVHLTVREVQILKLIAQGLHNRQIAARIHRSIKTV